MILFVYVQFNEKKYIAKIADVIHEQTRGEVKIEGLSVGLISTFPSLSLQLSDVVLKDSLFALHRSNLLEAEKIYLNISIGGLITGSGLLRKVTLKNAIINILTDSTGYNNEYVLKSRKKSGEQEFSAKKIPQIILKKVRVKYINALRAKLHEVQISSMKCAITKKNNELNIHTRLDMVVSNLGFNTNKGSFLKGKNLSGNFMLQFNEEQKDLLVKNVLMYIDNQAFFFDGKFHFDKVSPDFNLSIKTYKIDYKKAVSVLNDTLSMKFNAVSFDKPLDISVDLNGKTLYKYVPAVRIIMDLDLQSANSFGSSVLNVESGRAAINININAPHGRGDTVVDKMDGSIIIKDAIVKYIPKNTLLKKLNGTIRFVDEDLIVDKFTAEAGSTKLQMNARADNFVAVLNREPEKVEARWNIYSPAIYLQDFIGFISDTKHNATPKTNRLTPANRVDHMFTEGNVYFSLKSPLVSYKNFKATSLNAELFVKQKSMHLNKVLFKHADGVIEMKGMLKRGGRVNNVNLNAKMDDINVPLLFSAFNNFGQDALTANNFKGILSATVDYNTIITNDAKIVGESSVGKVNFIIKKGELNNFEPIQHIGAKFFKKQDFSSINFADLKNHIDVKGSAFIINPMEIKSSALNLAVEGIYDFKKGTDMSIRLPVSNFTKKTELTEDAKPEKGIGIRLRARSDESGKLKISWDPFKRSIKKKEEMIDSGEVKN